MLTEDDILTHVHDLEDDIEYTDRYQILDSLDRPCGVEEDTPIALYRRLQVLQEEAEEEGDGLTYAIAKVLPDGTVTYEF